GELAPADETAVALHPVVGCRQHPGTGGVTAERDEEEDSGEEKSRVSHAVKAMRRPPGGTRKASHFGGCGFSVGVLCSSLGQPPAHPLGSRLSGRGRSSRG